MSYTTEVIYGHQYAKANLEKTFVWSPTRVAATTPGKKASLRKKMDGNEDAMSWSHGDGIELFAVADSHFGSAAADIAVSKMPHRFQTAKGDILRAQTAAHISLDEDIRDEKKRRGSNEVYPGCSTTLITCGIKGDYCYWVSSGDSRLFLIRNGHLDEVNERHETLFLGDLHHYPMQLTKALEKHEIIDIMTEQDAIVEILVILGEMEALVRSRQSTPALLNVYMKEIEGITGNPFPITADALNGPWHPLHLELHKTMPRRGRFQLQPNDLICLASDGIEEDVAGIGLNQIAEVLANDTPLEKKASQLLKKCMGRRGGNDNLSFILASF